MRLLVVEDNPDISKALVTILKKSNYSVDAVYCGVDALEYSMSGNYDGMILDIMIPEPDGIEVLRSLRAKGIAVPVLILTAKSEVDDRVNGLDAGADDYLQKPFAMSELLARVRAMLRRKGEFTPDIMMVGETTLNKGSFELEYHGNTVRLVNKEYQMLEMLMNHAGNIITTEQFMERIWGWDSEVEVSIIWVYISNIRKKILSISAPLEIRAVRGVGYYLEKLYD